jgi:TP901 family phage tail tape measure protein
MAEPIGEAYVEVTADISDVKSKLNTLKGMFAKLKSGGSAIGGLLGVFSKLANIVTAVVAVFLAFTKVIGALFTLVKTVVKFVTNVVFTVLNTLGSILKGVLSTALNVVTGSIKVLFAALKELVRQIRSAIDTFMVFQQAMLTVKAVSGATILQYGLLQKKALELGRSTEFTAAQAAEAMTNFSRAGFRAQQTLDAIGGTLDFATAAATSMHQATEIVTGVLGSLNLEATQTAHAMDVLMVASNNARTTAVELGEAFGRVGAIGAFMGTDITNLSASLMSLAESSMRGLEGGMQLRMMLRRFTDPKVVSAFKQLNVQLFDMQGNLRLTHDIVRDFEDATKGWNKQQKTAIVLQTLTARSSYPFLALLQQGSAEIQKNWEMLQNVNGATRKFAETIRSSLVKQLIIVKSAWQDLQIVIGETFAPIIIKVAKKLVTALNSISNMLRRLKPTVQLLLEKLWKNFPSYVKTALKFVEDFLNAISGGIARVWKTVKVVWANIGALLKPTTGFFHDLFGVQFFGSSGVENVLAVLISLFTHLRQLMRDIGTIFMDFFSVLKNSILPLLPLLIMAIGDLLNPFNDKATRKAAVANFESVLGKMLTAFAIFGLQAGATFRKGWRDAISAKGQSITDMQRAVQAAQQGGPRLGTQLVDMLKNAWMTLFGNPQVSGGFVGFILNAMMVAKGKLESIPVPEPPPPKVSPSRQRVLDQREAKFKRHLLAVENKMRSLLGLPLLEDPSVFKAPTRREGESSTDYHRRARGAREEWDMQRKGGPLAPSPPTRGSAMGMTGTIQTIHGTMKVAVSQEVVLLREQVRLQRMIARNTETVALT